MRDLKRAMKEGPKAFFNSLADFPHRHPFLISGFVGGLALVLLLFAPGGLLDQKGDINVQRKEITKIGSLCGPASLVSGSEAQKACIWRTRIAIANCLRDPVCLANLKGTNKAAAEAGPTQGSAKGVVIGGGHNPSGHPGGSKPPASGKHQGSQGGGQPGATAQPSPAGNGVSSEPPGQSGETPGQSDSPPPGQSGAGPGRGSSVVEGAEGVVQGVGQTACSLLDRIEGLCPK
jgi:hypothetical protein